MRLSTRAVVHQLVGLATAFSLLVSPLSSGPSAIAAANPQGQPPVDPTQTVDATPIAAQPDETDVPAEPTTPAPVEATETAVASETALPTVEPTATATDEPTSTPAVEPTLELTPEPSPTEPLKALPTRVYNGPVMLDGEDPCEGPDLVIPDGVTCTLASGTYLYNSIAVQSGGTLLLQGNPAVGTHGAGVTLTVTSTVAVDAGGLITADQQGFVGQQGPARGWGEVGGNGAGASHGAEGGHTWSGHGTPGQPYGQAIQPISLGSGAGSPVGSGGGAIHLVVGGAVTVNGTVSARGADAQYDFYSGNGGAAGGSIWIQAASFGGNGLIRADGGAGSVPAFPVNWGVGGGGGGGRIAIDVSATTFSGSLTTYGGIVSAAGSGSGGAGTVLWVQDSHLIVDNNDAPGSGSAAGLAEGAYQFGLIELRNGGHLSVLGAASAITITSASGIQGDGGNSLITQGTLNLPSTLVVSGVTLDAYGVMNGGENMTVGGTPGLASGLVLRRSAPQKDFVSLTVGISGTVSAVPLNNGNTVYTDDEPLELRAGSLTVAEGGAITADGLGYGGQRGPAPGMWAEGSNGAGASHGGAGGKTSSVTGTPGQAYGDVYHPTTLGSGAASPFEGGGGAIHLVITATAQIDGIVSANGLAATFLNTSGGGGASGGSIWLEAATLTGSGTIQANGGAGGGSLYYGTGGGGGGGRIAIDVSATTFSGSLTTYGGIVSAAGSGSGGAGTVLWVQDSHLIVDNNDAPGSGSAAGLAEGAYQFGLIELRNGGHLSVLGAASAITITSASGIQGDGGNSLITQGTLNLPSTLVVSGVTLDAYGVMNGGDSMTVGGTPGLASGLVLRRSAPQKDFVSLTVGISGTVSAVPLNNGNTVYTDDEPLELRAGSLTVAEGGAITADGLGYGGQRGPAPGMWAEGSNGAGASHGGAGGKTSSVTGTPGQAYGDVYHPTTLGSGAASPFEGGGGAIHLVITGTAQIDGIVSANGLAATFLNTSGGGGASGGSLWLEAATLTGSGTFQANGGAGGGSLYYGTGGGGGGGRITIDAATGSFAGLVVAFGNANADGSAGSGGSGTVYWAQADRLVIANNDAPRSNSAAGLIEGAYQFTLIELRDSGNLETLGATSAITLTSASSLQGDSTGTFTTWGTVTLPSTLTVSGLTLDPRGTINGANDLTIGGTPGIVSGLILRGDGTQKVFGSLTVAISGTLTAIPKNNGDSNYADDLPVTIQASTVTVETGGVVTADWLGYGPGMDDGVGPGAGDGNFIDLAHAGGGGHGGAGGAGLGYTGGASYGDPKAPVTLGSAGGAAYAGGYYGNRFTGGSGGGAIHFVVSGALQVNGRISANGQNAAGGTIVNTPYGAGAGSGGSLWIQAGSLSGSGMISANGGFGQFGTPETGYDRGAGGGGGRIAFDVPSFAFSGTVSALGGLGYNKGGNGSITGMPFPRRSMRSASAYGDLGVCSTCEFVQTVGGPINTLTGVVDFSAIDLSFPALGGDIRFVRTYSTDYVGIATSLGAGWTHNLDTRLIFSDQPGGVAGQVLVKLHSANEFIFIEVSNPAAAGTPGEVTYQPYPGVLATLVKDSANNRYLLTTKDQGVYAFKDSVGAPDHGKLISWTDPQGHVQTYAYDPTTGLLTGVTAGDRTLTLTYSGGRIQSVQDHTGRSASFGYDGNGDLTSVTDVRGEVWTYAYDGASHRLATVTDPDGRIIERNEYYGDGRAWRQFNGANQLVVELAYTANPDGTTTVVVTDAHGNAETLTYDRLGTLVAAQSPSGTVDKTFDGNFHAEAVSDENGNPTEYRWSVDGQVLTQTVDALGNDTLFQYDALNHITRTVDARGNETTALYAGSFLTATTNALSQQTLYTYTTAADAPQPAGLLKALSNAAGETTTYGYNAYGQPLTVTNAAGQTMSYAYDALGRVTSTTDYSGRVTLTDYNAAGQVVTTTANYLAGQPQNHQNLYNLITVHDYDGAGRLRWTRDTEGRTDWVCYDAAGRVYRTVQNATGDGLTPATDPCDAANYVASSDPAEDRIATTVYDDAGNVSATIDAAGIVSRTYYDESSRPYLTVQNFTGGDLTGTITSTIPAWTAAFPDRNVRGQTVYDPAGNVVQTIDNAGLVSATCYDALNRPVKTVQNPTVADPCGTYTPSGAPDQDLTETTTYDENGNVLATTDPLGRVTRTWYDVLNRPITVTVNFTGDLADLGAPAYDPAYSDRNLTTETVYDAAGRAYKSVDGVSGRADWTCYDETGRVTRTVQNAPGDPCGSGWSPSSAADEDVATTYTYDATTGRQIAVTAADGQITRTYFDETGRQAAQTANLTGQAIAVETVPAYNPAYPDQNVTTRWGYDALGRTITTTVAAGSAQAQTTHTCYDALGRVAKTVLNPSVADPCGSYTPSSQTDRDVATTYTYDAAGNQIATTDTLGRITRTYYDDLGRTIAVVANLTGQGIAVETVPAYDGAYPDRNVRAFTSYDASGRVLETTDNAGLVTRQTYDSLGRTITTTVNYISGGPVDDVTNLASGTVYDKLGNVTRSIDAEGVQTGFDYDWVGRLITVTENLVVPGITTESQNVRTGYAYDGRGNRLTITDGRGKLTTFTYDDLDRQRTEQDALGNTWTTTYTKIGLTVSLLDANGQTTGYSYDGLRRVTGIDYPAGTADVAFTYDALGNRSTMTDGTGVTSWALDALNRPITITAPSGAVGYGYDRLGNRTQLRYPDTKAVTYTVDALNRIATVQDWASAYTSYTYNAAGQVVTTTLPNGVRTVYGYDAAQRLQSLAHSTTAQTLGAYTYTVNAVGNRTAVTETQAALEATAASPDRFDTIYADGFEAGGLTGWTSQSGTGLSVSSTAALAGGLGYSVAITSTTARYVQSALPTAEKHYRARFLFDPNTITMTSGTAHFLFRGYVGASTDVVQVEFRRNGAAYELRAGGRNDASAYTYTPWTVITDAAHAVELDWQAATAAGANNGAVALWIDQVAAGSATTLDNDTRAIDTARLGAVAGLDTGTTGTLYFDAFEDRRVPTVIGAETSLPDRLFTNSFESNSLANWVVYGPGITTTTAANLAPGQSIGAAVAVTSTQTTRYLEDLTPNRESRYRARVYFDPNGLTMAVNNSFNLLNIYTGTTEIGRLEFQYVATGYRLRGAVRNDASAYTYTGWTTLADSAHVLEIDWRAATGPGANDGGLTLWIDGTQVGALSGVDNDTRRVDRARIGAVGLDAGTTGTFYLDAFESRRASAIGPVQVAGSALTTTAIAYGYDPLYRLTSASYSDGTLFGYAYDAVGNVLTKTQTISGTPATQTYAYDDANRQTSAAGLAQTYDNNGNLTHDGTTAYTWDGANRMTASGSTAYTYNGLNDRVSAGGVTHQLDLNVGLTQVLADGTNTYLYGAGRLGEQQGVAWQYHLADGLGSVRQLADASGALSAARSYEPYGEVLGSAGAASSTYGFTGEQQEASGKLVYLRARYYQAETMRFASRDTWAGVARDPISLNKWVYGAASPIVYMDPSGNCYVPRDLLASALRFFESPMFGMCKAVKATTSQPTPARPTTATPGTATPAAPTPTATPTVRPTGTGTASPAASPTVRPTSNVTPGFTSTPRPHGFGDIFCPNDVFASSSAIRKAGISLSEEYLNVLSLLVYWESSKGNTPLAYSEMKIWSLLNRINDYWDQPSRSVASIWIGAEGLLIEQTLGIPSPTDDPIATWASLVADEPYWRAEPGYQDIRDAVDRIYPQWRSQGSNSVLDPTHGATAFNDIVDCRNVEPGFVCMHLVDRTSYDAVYAYRQERIQFWRDRQRDQPELNVIISGIYVITTLDGMPVYNFTIFGGCPDYPKNLYCLKS